MSEPKFNEGDEVYISGVASSAIRKGVIDRVTKTQAIIQHARYEERFNRQTGRLVGGGQWNATWIDHPTPALDKRWREERVQAARRGLREAADMDDPVAIRAAYERWDRIESNAVEIPWTTNGGK